MIPTAECGGQAFGMGGQHTSYPEHLDACRHRWHVCAASGSRMVSMLCLTLLLMLLLLLLAVFWHFTCVQGSVVFP